MRWSGESAWIPLGDFEFGVGFENATSYPAPGQVLLYPGGYSETEILFPYGSCCFASKMGQLAGNHFLTVVEGNEHLPTWGSCASGRVRRRSSSSGLKARQVLLRAGSGADSDPHEAVVKYGKTFSARGARCLNPPGCG